jgi:flagellar protein FliS
MLATYQSVAAHGGVDANDPQRLILLLLDGALDRIAQARGCIARGAVAEKSRLLDRVIAILGELRASLDHARGGQIALNLDSLYEYIERQLLRASAEMRPERLDEISTLLQEIRSAWIALPAQASQPEARAR